MHLPIKVVVALVVVNFPDPSSRQTHVTWDREPPINRVFAANGAHTLYPPPNRVVGNQALVLINFG